MTEDSNLLNWLETAGGELEYSNRGWRVKVGLTVGEPAGDVRTAVTNGIQAVRKAKDGAAVYLSLMGGRVEPGVNQLRGPILGPMEDVRVNTNAITAITRGRLVRLAFINRELYYDGVYWSQVVIVPEAQVDSCMAELVEQLDRKKLNPEE
jgi:hypothetical protein